MFKQLKLRNSLHHSQTSVEVQQEKRKMKKDEMKKKKNLGYDLGFYFHPTMWISSKQ